MYEHWVKTWDFAGANWDEIDREQKRAVDEVARLNWELIQIETLNPRMTESGGRTTIAATVRGYFRRPTESDAHRGGQKPG
jgi:hypothetical protein